jgi:hypothetical protein
MDTYQMYYDWLVGQTDLRYAPKGLNGTSINVTKDPALI